MSARNTFAATRRSHTILQWLRQGESVSIIRVSETFGVKYPQAREDLKLLEEVYGLKTAREGRTKVWKWSKANDISISVATAAALELGGVALDIFRDTPHGEAIEDLARACRDRLTQKQRMQAERLSQALHMRRTWLPTKPEQVLEALEEILDALALEQDLVVLYQRADGEENEYRIEPRRLIWYQGRLWLQALHGEQTRLFDVAGIGWLKRVPSAGRRSQADGAGGEEDVTGSSTDHPGELFKDSFGIYMDNYPVADVELEVSGPWANYFRRYKVHPSQRVVEIPDGIRVFLHVRLCPEFRSFLQSMLPDVDVIAPEDLREDLRLKAARWARRMAHHKGGEA
jgi:predicted DNA-binding transcriptional regulator YafY